MIQKMMLQHRKFMKGKKGFSLVELIIVIAIMAALVAILAPQYIRYVAQSRDAALEAAANEVVTIAKAEVALGNLGDCDIVIERGSTPTPDPANAFDATNAGYAWATLVEEIPTGANGNVTEYTVSISTTDGITTVSAPVDTTD